MVVRLIKDGKTIKLDLSNVKRITALLQATVLVVMKTGETITGTTIEF